MSENVAECSWMVGRPSVMMVAPAGPEHVGAARVKKLDSGKKKQTGHNSRHPQHRSCPPKLCTAVSTKNWDTTNNAQAGYRDVCRKSKKVYELLKIHSDGR